MITAHLPQHQCHDDPSSATSILITRFLINVQEVHKCTVLGVDVSHLNTSMHITNNTLQFAVMSSGPHSDPSPGDAASATPFPSLATLHHKACMQPGIIALQRYSRS